MRESATSMQHATESKHGCLPEHSASYASLLILAEVVATASLARAAAAASISRSNVMTGPVSLAAFASELAGIRINVRVVLWCWAAGRAGSPSRRRTGCHLCGRNTCSWCTASSHSECSGAHTPQNSPQLPSHNPAHCPRHLPVAFIYAHASLS